MVQQYNMTVTRKGHGGIQTYETFGLSTTPMRMRAEAYRQAHTIGTITVVVADENGWVGTVHGVDSPANENLWFTADNHSLTGLKAQALDSKGRLGAVL